MNDKSRSVKPQSIPFQTLKDSPTPGLFLKNIGRNGDEMRKHPHRDDYYMIAFITQGSVKAAIDFNEKSISAGEIVIISPSQVHSPSAASDKVEGWLLALASEHFTEHEAELAEKYALHTSPLRFGDNMVHDLKILFEMLAKYIDRYPVALALAESIKKLILVSLNTEMGTGKDRYVAIVLQLKRLLERKLTDEKSPSAYARMLNLSEVYLNEAVKMVTGMNVSGFIRNQVVLQAKRQLVYTSLSAQEIALALGYEDYAYFSKLFKKETGVSPIHYRKNLK